MERLLDSRGLLRIFRRQPVVAPLTPEAAKIIDPLLQEKNRTSMLLARINELVPNTGVDQGYHTQTLKGRMGNTPLGQQGSLFLRSVSSLLKEEEGRLHVNLRRDGGSTWLNIGWPADKRLVVSVDWKKTGRVVLDTQPFLYLPSPDYLRISTMDAKPTLEIAGQIYSNVVLKAVLDDLEDNLSKWKSKIVDKRATYFKEVEETRGKDGLSIVKRSLKQLADLVGEEPYMVFAPKPEANKDGKISPIILYTTANLTPELADRFSRISFLWSYPTQFHSSNGHEAKRVISTTYSPVLTSEIRQTKSLQGRQEYDLGCSFSGFMSGREGAINFTIFPPDEHSYDGIETTLVAVNPGSPVSLPL